MTIKSDKWIKRMAQEHQLIEPFTENQVRDANSGNKIISYGVSSFGYDVRCACLLYTSPSPRDCQ